MRSIQFHALARFWLALLLLLIPANANAHPHIFVDCSVTAVFDAQGLQGFEQTWLFDEIFTVSILEDYDTDRDSEFSKAEASRLESEIFSILEDYHFLTVLRVDGTNRTVPKARNFRPSVRGGKLCYAFFTPCPVPLDGRPHDAAIAVFDEEYYADMALPETAATVATDNAPAGLTVRISSNPASDLTYFGLIVPNLIHFGFGPR